MRVYKSGLHPESIAVWAATVAEKKQIVSFHTSSSHECLLKNDEQSCRFQIPNACNKITKDSCSYPQWRKAVEVTCLDTTVRSPETAPILRRA
jgi:hypothetical protein